MTEYEILFAAILGLSLAGNILFGLLLRQSYSAGQVKHLLNIAEQLANQTPNRFDNAAVDTLKMLLAPLAKGDGVKIEPIHPAPIPTPEPEPVAPTYTYPAKPDEES